MTAITAPLAFDIWEALDTCPYCGSDDVEIDLLTDEYVCCDCKSRSASYLSDGMEVETWLINNLDRFDYIEIFEHDRPGE